MSLQYLLARAEADQLLPRRLHLLHVVLDLDERGLAHLRARRRHLHVRRPQRETMKEPRRRRRLLLRPLERRLRVVGLRLVPRLACLDRRHVLLVLCSRDEAVRQALLGLRDRPLASRLLSVRVLVLVIGLVLDVLVVFVFVFVFVVPARCA